MDPLGCLISFFGLLALPFAYVVNGWALSILWRWFVVSTLNLPSLSIPAAIGIAIIAGYLTEKGYEDEDSKNRSEGDRQVYVVMSLVYAFARPLVSLGVGWIVLQFM